MTGERHPFPVSRAAIERHMAHVTDQDALRLVFGMSATASLAARLRNLESTMASVMDRAMTPDDEGKINGALALKAGREVRSTIELMGRVAGTLIDRVERDETRPDLDQQIEDAMRARGQVSSPAPTPEPAKQEAREPVPMLALPPARKRA